MNGKAIRLSKCSIGEEERDAVLRVLDNEFFGMGKEVQAFENEIKSFLKTENEVVCVNTGTSALHLALMCLDIGVGDKVLVPTLTYVASFQAISATGAEPIACDVIKESGFIDLKDAESKMDSNVKAIMPVHYASNCNGIDEVYEFANKHSLRIVEDAAHSIGSIYKGRKVGCSGDIVCFSFDGIKNITSGEGGAIVTSDSALAERLRDARLLGVEKDTENRFKGQRSWEFNVNHQGLRYHMSDLMAAIGRAQLQKIEGLKRKRQSHVSLYIERLGEVEGVRLFDFSYDEICPHIFVIKVKKRDELRCYLIDKGIAVGVHYYLNHKLDKYRAPSLKNAEALYDELLTLPLHPDLTREEIDYTCNAIKDFFTP